MDRTSKQHLPLRKRHLGFVNAGQGGASDGAAAPEHHSSQVVQEADEPIQDLLVGPEPVVRNPYAVSRSPSPKRVGKQRLSSLPPSQRWSRANSPSPVRGQAATAAAAVAEDDKEEEWCFCKGKYPSNAFMIACDGPCDNWYHGTCVGVDSSQADHVVSYVCSSCETATRHTVWAEGFAPPPAKRPRRSCLREQCERPARPGSKYCSDRCGLRAARERIGLLEQEKEKEQQQEQQQQQQQQQQVNGTEAAQQQQMQQMQLQPRSNQSVAKDAPAVPAPTASAPAVAVPVPKNGAANCDAQLLESVERDLAACDQRVAELNQRFTLLQDAIERCLAAESAAPSPTPSDASSVPDTAPSRSTSTGDERVLVDCVSCGQPVPARVLARHIDACASRSQIVGEQLATVDADVYCGVFDRKSKQYCHNLKATCSLPGHNKERLQLSPNTPCGCPIDQTFCQVVRRSCLKHVNWERLRTAEITQDRSIALREKQQLQLQAEAIRRRMERRAREAMVYSRLTQKSM